MGNDDPGMRVPGDGLFCVIGAVPARTYLTDGASVEDGFGLTDKDISEPGMTAFSVLGRRSHPFTSVPGVSSFPQEISAGGR
jgi:hypothetical protein